MYTKSLILLVLAGLNPSLMAGAFIQNPSFEANYNDGFPHYGPIDSWAGGSGVNEASGPFHNSGTPIPDQNRVAFLQGSTSVRQTISGLTPDMQYWIQFFYDARACCGGTIDLLTKFNDEQLDRIPNVRPATGGNPYLFRNVLLTNAPESGELKIETVANGDATVVLDAITIVERGPGNVPVANPSFEASGIVPDTGMMLAPANLAGWMGTGEFGVTQFGTAFADNGAIPDQDNVVFLQGASSISQQVSGLEVGSNYVLKFFSNSRNFDVSHLVVRVDDTVLADLDVSAVGGEEPYHAHSLNFVAAAARVTVTFEQTVPGAVLLLDNIALEGKERPPLPCLGLAPVLAEVAPNQTVTVTVEVPPALIAAVPATIKFRSGNTNVVRLAGAAEDGILALEFAVGGPAVKTFELETVARGTMRVEIVDSATLCIGNDVSVNVVSSFVRNPSFESTAAPAGVGYGAIVGWTGGSGINRAAGPFHNAGTPVPDREQVAFLQNSGTLSQQITGLTPGKHYWLQFRYDARACCEGGTISFKVKFGGVELADFPEVIPATGGLPYYFGHAEFDAADTTGLLEFSATANGDATLLLDAISIVEREPGEVVLENPSFEATGYPAGVGYIQPNRIAGWNASGAGWGPNINGVGPFTDNGLAPDQDVVVFMQNAVTLGQNITNFTPGELYTLIYSINSRSCCVANALHYVVTLGGLPLMEEDISPVGGANPYHERAVTFTADAAESELQFQSVPSGDQTLLLDNIRIIKGVPRPNLRARWGDGGTIRISWPASVTDFGLQSSESLSAGWTEVITPIVVEENENVVYELASPGIKYYRLMKP